MSAARVNATLAGARPALGVLLALAVAACGRTDSPQADAHEAPTAAHDDAGPTEVALLPPSAPGAAFRFGGETYTLSIPGSCGPDESGDLVTWGVTLDQDGQPVPDGPQFVVIVSGAESVIDFYRGTGEVTRIRRDGPERLAFEGGRLAFSGEVDGQQARFEIRCPSSEQDADRS